MKAPLEIKPYHLLAHAGSDYLIQVDDMVTSRVDPALAKRLRQLCECPPANIPDAVVDDLRELGLVVDMKQTHAPLSNHTYPVVSMSLFLTQSCNMRCVYCFEGSRTFETGRDMDKTTAFRAVDWLLETSGHMKHVHVGFLGGEPFLRFSLMQDVVSYARERSTKIGKRVHFSATSNATMFDDEVVHFIKDENISVLVSIDGPREIQDGQRPLANGAGSYDVVAPGIKRLLAVVPDTPGHAVLFGDTDPARVKEALLGMGFVRMSFLPASQCLSPDGRHCGAQARNTGPLMEVLEEEGAKWLEGIAKRDVGALVQLKNHGELFGPVISLLHNSKRLHACGAGLGMVAVSPTGDIYLCHRFVGHDAYKLGSIFCGELQREKYVQSVIQNPVCASCFARYYCAGGCKHDNAGATGAMEAPAEDMCRKRRRELELAAVIVCNLSAGDRAFLLDAEVFPPKPCPLDF